MHDLIIVGAGPAGLAAALYAGRFKLSTLIFEKMSTGGQILLSPSIENYPGFPGGVSTFELVDKFKEQVEELGLTIEDREVSGIVSEERFYTVKTTAGDFKTRAVIISTGAQSKRLGVKGEDKFIGKGVSYCGTCDGPLFKDKEIIVVGGGDRAVEDAIFLSNYAKKIYIVHRRNEFRAAKILVDKMKNDNKIKPVLSSVVEEISGSDKVDSVKIRNVITNEISALSCQGVFIFVGITPQTDFVKGFLKVDDSGFIITDQDMNTSKGGIFACGDCIRKSLYQVVGACSDGATAADSAHKYLLRQ
jgi:thioredoxin reductase (NADPH)